MSKIKSFVVPNTWLGDFTSHGWGNGYVVIPKGHKLHGKHYDDISVDVHGGLTFSEPASELKWKELPPGCKTGWVIGFDTAHYQDNLSGWSKQAVEKETEHLRKQIEAL